MVEFHLTYSRQPIDEDPALGSRGYPGDLVADIAQSCGFRSTETTSNDEYTIVHAVHAKHVLESWKCVMRCT